MAAAQPRFADLPARRTGVTFTNTVTDHPDHNILIYSNYYGGAGVGVGDFDRDGRPDLFFAGNLVKDELYRNLGDLRFERQTGAGILEDDGWSSGVVVADVNQDGWPDVYVTRELYDDEPDRRANLLYLNDGDGTFTETAAGCGVADTGRSRHATFFDYDRDGKLDLYVLNQPPNPGNYSPRLGTDLKDDRYRSKLYRNTGNDAAGRPRFVEVDRSCGIAEVGFPNSVLAADFDRDGWTDLYVTHDYDAPDRLYRNNGDGTFTDRIQEATGHISYYSMGVDGADVDGDGWLDLMVLDMVAEDNYRLKANMSGMDPAAFQRVVAAGGHYQYMFNTLQLNRGGRGFSEVAHLAGVATTDWSWSNLFADLDNDGWSDLFVTNGLLRDIRNTDAAKDFATYVSQRINAYIQAHPDDSNVTIYDVIDLEEALATIPSQPLSNYAYANRGDGTFAPRTRDWGLGRPGFSTGAAYADLDGDGDLDLIVSNVNARAAIYENRGAGGNYLRLNLTDPGHRSSLGARITVTAGGRQRYAELANVRGMYSTSENVAHFGLGTAARAERVEIVWPDGRRSVLTDVGANQQLDVSSATATPSPDAAPAPSPVLEEVSERVALPYRHRENVFDDYRYQVLLPHQPSRYGPAAAVGDIDGDGLDDLFLGGASGQPGGLYRQRPSGDFAAVTASAATWQRSSLQEDVGATFFDADADGDPDLYVASGGNEFPAASPFYQDRLYRNDGGGNFTPLPDALPVMTASTATVRAADFDGDGDLDLFVGGRLSPRDYPAPPPSFLLRNDGAGRFTDVTDELAPYLRELGMVTAAEWTDFDGDGRPDLLVVGEWMPLTLLLRRGNRFERRTDFTDAADATTGWWFGLHRADLDGDGDDDFVFGNLGENHKYRASPAEPFEVHYDDFDGNGRRDIVLSYYNAGDRFPLRGRACSAQQIPGIAEQFPSYSDFAGASLTDVFAPAALKRALHYSASGFASLVGINEGGRLRLTRLPAAAQYSTVQGIVADDVNGDGHPDLLLGGNLYPTEVETPRADASLGLLLTGDGRGNFTTVPAERSGLHHRDDLRQLLRVRAAEGQSLYLGIVNDGPPRVYRKRGE